MDHIARRERCPEPGRRGLDQIGDLRLTGHNLLVEGLLRVRRADHRQPLPGESENDPAIGVLEQIGAIVAE